MVYEVNNISSGTLSSAIAEVGTYMILGEGKYQIRMAGEAPDVFSAGILIANTYYNMYTPIVLKRIKAGNWTNGALGGAGVALWDSSVTTGVPKLVAGGAWSYGGGGGYTGGYDGGARDVPSSTGYGWNGSRGGNSSYCCTSIDCTVGATGGCAHGGWVHYGGTGTGVSGYPCPTGYACTTIAGGWKEPYVSADYGNWSATAGDAKGYVKIIYCGPSTDSTCPASCGNNVACATGTCNYHTGLCE